jgi:hypothetical protein
MDETVITQPSKNLVDVSIYPFFFSIRKNVLLLIKKKVQTLWAVNPETNYKSTEPKTPGGKQQLQDEDIATGLQLPLFKEDLDYYSFPIREYPRNLKDCLY